MSAQQRLASVPDDLTPEQLERWANGLVDFLTSDDVPTRFRGWARAQADAIDAQMADDGFDDGDDEDDVDDEGEVAPADAPAKPRAPTAAFKHAARREHHGADRSVAVRLPANSVRLLLGVAIGVVALVAIVAVRNRLSDADGAPLPVTADAATFDQARADELEGLLQQDPANKEALFELGEMNFQAGRYEDMIPWFTELVELEPANKHALTDLGTAHFNLGQPVEARIWWEKVIAVDANDVQAHYNLGFMYANAEPRDVASAVHEWEEVLRLDPESQLAQTARVHIDGLKAELGGVAGGGASTPSPANGATPVATAP
jgi:cytochrome c-type biogenesis protein CcmH/NrfG